MSDLSMNPASMDPAPAPDFPTLRPERSGVPVLAAGALTTLLALAGEIALQGAGFNAMGWYASYVVPLGAGLVGLVASSGFGAGSWFTGTKISGRLLGLTLLILFAGYFGAQWFEYRRMFPQGAAQDGTPVSFLFWFDYMTRSFAFEGKHGEAGEALGALGYGVRALEVIGFVGGGALVPFVLRARPYCDACNLYMRSRALGMMPANLSPKMFGDKSPERQEERTRVQQAAQAGLDTIFAAATKDSGSVTEAIATHAPLSGKKAASKATTRIEIALVHCRSCHCGRLEATEVSVQGRNVTRRKLGQRELQPGTVEGLTQA